jgi:hypothetical protein
VQLNDAVSGARLIGTVSSAIATGLATSTLPTQATSPPVVAPLSCPSSNNITYLTSSGSQYLIECQTDHSGGK